MRAFVSKAMMPCSICGLVPIECECLKCVGRRVDGLVFAFRCSLDPEFVEALRRRGAIAYKHSRAAFYWRNIHPAGMAPVGARPEHGGPVRLGGLRARWGAEQKEANLPVEASEWVPWGELKYSRVTRSWTVTSQPFYILHVDQQAPGAQDVAHPTRPNEMMREGGWTIEIKFYAQWIAEVGLDKAIREAEAIAALCGKVHEVRLRRIDLCADVQNWEIGEEDIRRLVKRPRARWQKEYGGEFVVDSGGKVKRIDPRRTGRPSKEDLQQEEATQAWGRGALDRRQMTGLSVGRGGAMMSRIYDKRVELERDEERRVNEEARWTSEGWNGRSRVTRVEFQIRGTAIAEFGIRDPHAVKEVIWGASKAGRLVPIAQRELTRIDEETGEVHAVGLVDRIDDLWQSCLAWVRLVDRDEDTSVAATRLKDDARWALLRTVSFESARRPSLIKRVRIRTAASASQLIGVAFSRAAKDGKLTPIHETYSGTSHADDPFLSDDAAKEAVFALLGRVFEEQKLASIEDLWLKQGGWIGLWEHLAVRNNAAHAKFCGRLVADGEFSPLLDEVPPPPESGARAAPEEHVYDHDEESWQQRRLGFG